MRVGAFDIVRGDVYNVVVTDVVKHKKTGEEYLSSPKYFGRWENALMRVLDQHIVSEDAKNILKEIQDARKEIVTELKRLKTI